MDRGNTYHERNDGRTGVRSSFLAFYSALRRWLHSRASSELLTVCFFVLLSGAFWLMLTLDRSYEQELRVPVRITDVPSNVVLTCSETDTLSVTVSDNGFALWTYIYGDRRPSIELPYASLDGSSAGSGRVATTDLRRQVTQRLMATTRLTSMKPEQLIFSYNYGERKRVPVRYSGRVMPDELRFISAVSYRPDSVTVYAAPRRLDSIQAVYTEPLNYVGVSDTLHIRATLQQLPEVKVVPAQVELTFATDVLTEESIDGVPIRGVNMPEGKRLRTFPARVSVRFVTGLSVYRNLRPTDFVVVADYNELQANPSEKCRISLRRVPKGISRPTLDFNEVDYLIEEDD
ncbi:MAG: YbbR-like domain-containing protein [Prevotella sp.]|nr:YbbR-like domain-containing protein [Prevotella sp.]